MGKVNPQHLKILEGVSDNNTVDTSGKINDKISANTYWTELSNKISPTNGEYLEINNNDTNPGIIILGNSSGNAILVLDKDVIGNDARIEFKTANASRWTIKSTASDQFIIQNEQAAVPSMIFDDDTNSITMTAAITFDSTTDEEALVIKGDATYGNAKMALNRDSGSVQSWYSFKTADVTFWRISQEVGVSHLHIRDTTNNNTAMRFVQLAGTTLVQFQESDVAFWQGLETDSINELSTGAGVTIEGVKCLGSNLICTGNVITNSITPIGGGPIVIRTASYGVSDVNFSAAIKVDTISEHTATAGVTIDGVLCKDGYINQDGIFGGIHAHDNATSQSIPTGAAYTKVTAFTDDEPSANVTSDAANDKITLTQIGTYRVSGSFSYKSGTANVVFFGTPFLNAVEQDNIHFSRKVAVANDVGSSSFTGFIDVTSAPLDLDFRVRHDNAGAVDYTLTYANINVEYMGAT